MKVFDDHITLWNGGTLPPGYTVEKLMEPHESHPRNRLMANVFYLAGFIEAWGRGYEKIRNAFEKEKLEMPVFEEVRGGMMATIKREKFVAIQAKGGNIENGKYVVDVVIDNVVDKLSERQVIIYKMIRKSVVEGVVETASSIANKIKLSPRTIQRDLTRLKELSVIEHEGPDNRGRWVIIKDLKL
jgi:ATP-dependent DNA helicase RecG